MEGDDGGDGGVDGVGAGLDAGLGHADRVVAVGLQELVPGGGGQQRQGWARVRVVGRTRSVSAVEAMDTGGRCQGDLVSKQHRGWHDACRRHAADRTRCNAHAASVRQRVRLA